MDGVRERPGGGARRGFARRGAASHGRGGAGEARLLRPGKVRTGGPYPPHQGGHDRAGSRGREGRRQGGREPARADRGDPHQGGCRRRDDDAHRGGDARVRGARRKSGRTAWRVFGSSSPRSSVARGEDPHRRGAPVGSAGRRRQRLGKTTTIGKLAAQLTGRRARRCCSPRATPSAPPPSSSSRSGASAPARRSSRARRAPTPAAVAFDAVKRAQARGLRRLIIDTAGRLHTKAHLMEELKKVRARDGQAHARRAARDAAGARRHHRPERHRPGARVHRGARASTAWCSPSSTAPPRAGW